MVEETNLKEVYFTELKNSINDIKKLVETKYCEILALDLIVSDIEKIKNSKLDLYQIKKDIKKINNQYNLIYKDCEFNFHEHFNLYVKTFEEKLIYAKTYCLSSFEEMEFISFLNTIESFIPALLIYLS